MNTFTPAIRSALLSDAKNGPSLLRRWSIRDLLDFNLNNNNKSKTNNNAAIQNTKSLLQEVQIRLALQHGKLQTFYNTIDEYANVAKSEGEIVQKHLKNLRQLHENTYLLPHQIIDGDGRALLLPLGNDNNNNNFPKHNQKYISDVFDQIMSRHGTSVETLADAVIHARNMEHQLPGIFTRNFRTEAELLKNDSIESFLHSRLLIQLLSDHYISLNKGKANGAVSLDADVADVVDDAVTEAKHVCDANLGVAPEVRIIRSNDDDGGDAPPPPIIRSWLHHAIVEVTKNAMTSNVERWMRSCTTGTTMQQSSSAAMESLPPDVVIGVGRDTMASGDGGTDTDTNPKDCLIIRIMDQGIGLKDEKRAFGFARTASRERWDRLEEQQSYAAVRQPLGSLGVGLPLSKLMMRVFGGDLLLSNRKRGGDMDSGCTATLKINYDDTYKAKN